MKSTTSILFVIIFLSICTCSSFNNDDIEANLIAAEAVQNYGAITAEFSEPLPLTRVPLEQLNADKLIHYAILLIAVFW